MDLQPATRNNFIVNFVWKVYIQMSFLLNYWLLIITRFFTKDNSSDARFQRKTIINSLINNFASEEIKLINPNESVEDTFTRKINEKDYDSAIKLAKKFDFNMDLIYKSMWENNEINEPLIDKCLGKISNTIWTLKECVDCIPPQLPVLKHLLQLGIEMSSKSGLASYMKDAENEEFGSDNLTQEGKLYVQYRQDLICFQRRLNLYEAILQKRHKEYSTYFDVQFYTSFRKKSSLELAINFANQADYDALVVLFNHESDLLYKHFLVILQNLPEITSPIKYKDLLDIVFSLYKENTFNLETNQTIADWSAEFENHNQSRATQFEAMFYAKHEECQKYIFESHPTKDDLTRWFRNRAVEILDYTLLDDNCLQLLQYGVEQGFSVQDLYIEMDLYSLLIYENYQCMIPFEQFEQLTLTQKLNLILRNQAILSIENLFDQFMHKLANYKQATQLTVNKKELLREFLVNLAKTDFEQCLRIFESCSMVDKTLEEIHSFKIINDASDLIELAIECLHAYENAEDLDIAFQIMECLPDRSQADILMEGNASRIRHFNRINDRADQIEYYLSMIEVFRDYNTHLTVKYIDSIVSYKNRDEAELFFKRAINNFCTNQFANADISLEWKNFLWNLQDFRKNCLSMITCEQLIELCVHNLLFSASKIFIKIALEHISFKAGKVSSKKVQYEKGKEMLKKAASDYIKFANPVQDDNIELARACLQVFRVEPNAEEDILEELDLIDGLSIMYEQFKVHTLPIKIKQSAQPRVHLMQTIVQSCSTAYTKVSQLLRLAHLLRVCKDHTVDYREGVILSMIGKEALKNHDYSAVSEACQTVLERNLHQAWDLCYLFAKTSTLAEGITSNQQLAFLSFALAYCPETEMDAHFKILNEIKSIKLAQSKSSANTNFFIEFKDAISVK